MAYVRHDSKVKCMRAKIYGRWISLFGRLMFFIDIPEAEKGRGLCPSISYRHSRGTDS